MTMRRQPSIPPKIPGFEFVRLLGMGGFADVFEYRQEFPTRSVAVKVLLSGSLDQDAREAFFAEANVMARLSHHPSIVTVYHADIAADGRPYLVMEYCSRPGLGTRYRTERFTVAEVLRTGIRVASAVEAAHHLGILHRDIKPANILATDFGWPALTDFGIAATLGSTAEATGMSIPWSAPELLAENPKGDVRGDVYSIAATMYSLLVGHSPFEVQGRSNTPADLISRIEKLPLPPIEREDVPTGLAVVLARAMAKDPGRRFLSALALAHALQQVERSLHLPVTSIDLSQDTLPEVVGTARISPTGGQSTEVSDAVEDQATRLRPIVSIDAQGPDASTGGDPDATRLRPITTVDAQPSPQTAPVSQPVGPAPAEWVTSPPVSEAFSLAAGSTAFAPSQEEIRSQHYKARASELAGGRSPRRSRRGLIIGASTLVLGALGVVVFLAFGRTAEPDLQGTETPTPAPTVIVESAIPSPAKLTGIDQGNGQALFTWSNPDPKDGDTYLWRSTSADTTVEAVRTDKESALVPVADGQLEVCIEVWIVRDNGARSNDPAQECSQ